MTRVTNVDDLRHIVALRLQVQDLDQAEWTGKAIVGDPA
jgi:hypothetical protein